MKKIHKNISQKTLEAKNQYRDEIDLLRGRLNLLNGKDKVLMTMYLENGNSFRQIARLTGISDTSIARRINRLTKRLLDSQYIVCLRNRDKFTREQMTIAKDYFLTGLSIRKIALKRHRSFYRVRETMKKIQSILKDNV
ncbi:MAG: AsnC family protein [Phycisphaerae bacterium]